jgi:hypothetical protein
VGVKSEEGVYDEEEEHEEIGEITEEVSFEDAIQCCVK